MYIYRINLRRGQTSRGVARSQWGRCSWEHPKKKYVASELAIHLFILSICLPIYTWWGGARSQWGRCSWAQPAKKASVRDTDSSIYSIISIHPIYLSIYLCISGADVVEEEGIHDEVQQNRSGEDVVENNLRKYVHTQECRVKTSYLAIYLFILSGQP